MITSTIKGLEDKTVMQIFVHLLEFSKTDVGPFCGLFSWLWGDLFLDGVRPKVSRG